MQQVLLGLVRVVPDAFRTWRGTIERGLCHLRAHEPLNRVQARAGLSPLLFAIPGEYLAQHFGHAPAVSVAEPGEHRARHRGAERLNQFPSQQTQRDCVQEQYALAGERDDAALGGKVQELMNIEIGGSHAVSLACQTESLVYHFDSLVCLVWVALPVNN